jgi:outer membrane protein OmpA-like peptidoglycan-associated protein
MSVREPFKNWRSMRVARLTPAIALFAGAATLVWAFFWPDTSCSDPACVRKRFAISVELDAFNQVDPIELDVAAGDERISLNAIFSSGGVDAEVVADQADLPYKSASGALDRADLYQFTQAWRSARGRGDVDASIYALLAPALVSDSGEPLFGIMFDVDEREGFAVAPSTTTHRFGEREPASVPLLQLRTFAHELLHSLNRHHVDAVQMSDGRLTLEAPTRCISLDSAGQWSLREAPLMAISPTTIGFFQSAAKADVLPGKAHSPFRARRTSPTECEDARSNAAPDPARTRWDLARRRIRGLFAIRSASAQVPAVQDVEPAQASVELRIQALPAPYPLGYPLAVRLMARNTGSAALPIKGRLSPSYGIVRIEHRRAGQAEWSDLEPLAWFEPVSDEEALLLPDERTEHTVPIYFGEDGWTFPEPGRYEIRARMQTGSDTPDAVSSQISITFASPNSEPDQAALRPLIDDSGRLDDASGRLLAFGGRIGTEQTRDALEAAIVQYGDTSLGGALRLTLVTNRLRPTIDPRTGERPLPDFSDARELLADTCTDSGIAALKWQLLQRHAGGVPDNLTNRAETDAAAWDGTTSARGDPMPTYSDESLRPWGPSLHFCFNEARLRAPARAAIPRLVQQLRREQPERIVVVGHGDHEGRCRYNDGLALRRAQAVRRALLGSGLTASRIEVASLGERRPLDFEATGEAHDLNRRVEILIESNSAEGDELPAVSRIMPACGSVASAVPTP